MVWTRFDYENVCEMLLDEFCEVEKHVNMALLNLIVDTCCFTSQPFELLAKAALHPQVRCAFVCMFVHADVCSNCIHVGVNAYIWI